MKRAYEGNEATSLRPLIESIARELEDRFAAVRRLEKRLRRIERRGGSQSGDTRHATSVAELAEHRRNLRHITTELEMLGAEVEADQPVVIRLPGPDGSFDSGYRMTATGDVTAEQAA